MKKLGFIFLSVMMCVCISFNAFASDTLAVAASIVNSDSFVDKTATNADFDVPAKAALLMDEVTGHILYEKNADMPLHIASVTKVMTMLLVFEALESGKIKLTDHVPVSEHAFSMGGSQIWLEPGEIFTVEEMLKAVAVASANDAAVALAEFVGGSEAAFCDMMNKRAEELGMTNTHFENACGLDTSGHLSTARDVAVMSRQLMTHTDIYNYTTIWLDYLRDGQTQLLNTNKLLKSYNGTTGLKTGTTSGAGVCITATAKRDNMSFIAVVLGSASSEERFDAAKTLLDFGFTNFESKPFPSNQTLPETLPVKYSAGENVSLEYTLPESLLFLKGSVSDLEIRLNLPESMEAPVLDGVQIGSVGLYSQGEKIKEYPVLTSNKVDRMNFSSTLSLLIKSLCKM